MTTASRLAKQAVQTAKSLDVVYAKTKEKLEALLATKPSYVLIEPAPVHPYTALIYTAKYLVKKHDEIVATLLDLDIGSGSLREELDKMQAHRMYDEIELDSDVDRLRLMIGIDKTSITAKYIAENTLSMFYKCIEITDSTKLSELKYALGLQYEKKFIKNHIENPFLNITPDCKNALKEVKSMCKLLVTLFVNDIRVGSQIDAITAPKFLKL